jgi:hypothetical protein
MSGIKQEKRNDQSEAKRLEAPDPRNSDEEANKGMRTETGASKIRTRRGACSADSVRCHQISVERRFGRRWEHCDKRKLYFISQDVDTMLPYRHLAESRLE